MIRQGLARTREMRLFGSASPGQSESDSARVIFAPSSSHIRVTVEDDGKGFDPDKISENPGFGLRSMRGRAEAVGASLEVISASGKGTRVIILVPWRKEET